MDAKDPEVKMLVFREGAPEMVWLEWGKVRTAEDVVAYDVNRLQVWLGETELHRGWDVLMAWEKPARAKKLPGLLAKLRTEKVMGFNAADWNYVLAALGFGYKVTEKDGRAVEAVRIQAPSGALLDVRKLPGYRRIVFYGIDVPGQERGTTPIEWAKGQGYSLSDLASLLLGVETMAQERKRRDAFSRDWTHTGTCGVCERNVKMDELDQLVHHGYQRPGSGEIQGDCFGVKYQPFELSPKGAADFLEQRLRVELANVREYKACLLDGRLDRIIIPGFRTTEVVKRGEPKWKVTLDTELADVDMNIGQLEREVKRFEEKVAGWKLDELPEVKKAAFGPPPEKTKTRRRVKPARERK